MDHTICYISKQEESLTTRMLKQLFQFVVKTNPTLNISGVLLHNNNFFLQVLEGDKTTIQNLFADIRKDKRHQNILLILNQKIENRIFNHYEATFSVLKSKEDIERLNTYLSNENFKDKYSKNIKTLIEPFLL
ncbi:BLUF domain-containing protein [Aequorivita marisscotiae]|uniref:BLUF domain-containing protein n=1 Tax=Aequorivita marisscotiae TaxID=3040348 RepID=A0ABY8KX44_9FLAO|nr:BLUF domain-containing protein [Aequorivita sp. Ant34-E75]WGF93963.1 BLUF domain-containing protein [Aequorivita sp. Ant34-E75]